MCRTAGVCCRGMGGSSLLGAELTPVGRAVFPFQSCVNACWIAVISVQTTFSVKVLSLGIAVTIGEALDVGLREG